MSASLSTKCFHLTGHAVLRFGTAHLLDPIAAILRAHEDLALSHEATVEEARRFLGAGLAARKGRTYRIGTGGIYVCIGNRVITYIGREQPVRPRNLRIWHRLRRISGRRGRRRR